MTYTIPAPSEMGHEPDDYEKIFMPRDAERIRQNSMLELWKGRDSTRGEFTAVRRIAQPTQKCLHCSAPATITATRISPWGSKLPVKYCDDHARLRGVALRKPPVADAAPATPKRSRVATTAGTQSCEMCGKDFEAKRRTARFCSDRCRNRFRRFQ